MVYKIRRKTVQKPNNNNNHNHNNSINHNNNYGNLGVSHPIQYNTIQYSLFNEGDVLRLTFLVELEFNWNRWFLRRGEMRDTRRKTSGSRGENQQKTHDPHIRFGFEPGPHPWGASALTTAHAPLLSLNRKTIVYSEAPSHY